MEALDSNGQEGLLPEVPAARRPLVGFCLSALAGWLLGFQFAPSPWLLLAFATCGVALFAWRASARWSTCLAHASALVVAAAHASMVVAPPSPAHFSTVLDRPREFLEMVGTIADEPVRLDRPGDAQGPWVFAFEVEGLRRTENWQRGFGRIEVRWTAPSNAVPPAYGQRRLIAGVVAPRAVRRSAEPFLLQSRGQATLLAVDGRSRFYAWCLAQRQRASALLGRGLPDSEFGAELAMSRALVLGERTELDDRVRKAFARTGTLHVVAISGSHVAVFLSLLTAVFKAMGRPRTSWLLYASPILILYTVGTGLSASAVRACIMAVVFLAAPFFRRRVDAATALAIAALLILAAAPPQLFDPGFLLSFLVVGGLMAFYRGILRFFERWVPGDPWQLQVPVFTKLRRAAVRSIFSLFAASLAAWLVSAPLTAVFFHLSSPIALLANLLVVPLAYFILLSGCLSLSMGVLSPLAGEIFNHATRVFVDLMLRCVEWFDAVPGAYQFVRSPSWIALLVYYALLLLLFFGTRTLRRWAVVVALGIVCVWSGWHCFNQRMTVEWNGTGRTPWVFLDLPRDRDVLVNTGDRYQAASLVRFLHARGVDRLATLVLARPSAEAMGGALNVLKEIPADEVVAPGWTGRSKTFDAFVAACRSNGTPVRTLTRGQSGHWAGGLRWEVLHPGTNAYASAEQGGLVLHLSRGGKSMLFAGGGGTACESELLGASRDVVADVLLWGLRQGSPGWSEAMLAAARPRSRIEAAPDFGTVADAGVRAIPRDAIWRATWPGEKFQSLERVALRVSNPWNASPEPWWRGDVVPADPW